MPDIGDFGSLIEVATDGLSGREVAKALAATARSALRDAQQAGEFPAKYATFVNGTQGRSIDAVEPPGPIIFVAGWWPAICEYGIAFAKARSPVGHAPDPHPGRYRDSWFVMANGEAVTDYETIPFDAEVIIANPVPYARKIEVGGMRVSVPPGVAEDLATELSHRWRGLIRARRQFITLADAYVLQTSATGRRRRRTSTAGAELAYPAVVMSMTT